MIGKRYLILTVFIAVLTALAAAGGLFIPDLYRDEITLIPMQRGQDVVTLIVAPFLLITAIYAYRGSKRSLLIYIGLLAYILYSYTGAAFAYSFNKLVLVYIVFSPKV